MKAQDIFEAGVWAMIDALSADTDGDGNPTEEAKGHAAAIAELMGDPDALEAALAGGDDA